MSSTTIARAASPRGEVVLRRRDDAALELRVNGVFVMDTAETTTERALATLTLERLAGAHPSAETPPVRILVGGLGLGFTLRELLLSPLVGSVIVAEIEPALLEWNRSGLVPHTDKALRDPRVRVIEGDVRRVVEALPPGSLDAVILDVDNGPGFLVYDDNATLYEGAFLARCRAALAVSGFVVIWSADAAPELKHTLAETFGGVDHHTARVRLAGRDERYHAYLAPPAPATVAAASPDESVRQECPRETPPCPDR